MQEIEQPAPQKAKDSGQTAIPALWTSDGRLELSAFLLACGAELFGLWTVVATFTNHRLNALIPGIVAVSLGLISLKLARRANIKNSAFQANLQNAINTEQNQRLELEESLKPREIETISIRSGSDEIGNFTPLERFRGVNVSIRFLPESEPANAAFRIRCLLEHVGWIISEFKPDTSLTGVFFEGVKLVSHPMDSQNAALSGAGNLLAAFLTLQKWAVEYRGDVRSRTMPNTLIINVGLKPDNVNAMTKRMKQLEINSPPKSFEQMETEHREKMERLTPKLD